MNSGPLGTIRVPIMPTYDLEEAPLALFYACSVHVLCIFVAYSYAQSPNRAPRATYEFLLDSISPLQEYHSFR